MPVDDLGAEVARAFLRVDHDHTGRIDRIEFEELVEYLDPPGDLRPLSEIFDEIDTADDGTISYDEFMKWWSGV